MTTIKRFHFWRRVVGSFEFIALICLPFIYIGGKSALRFDIPSLRLHFFGTSIWMEDFFILLTALVFMLFLILFISISLGRIWCGWLCPQTVISDFTSFLVDTHRRSLVGNFLSSTLLFLLSAIISASLIWYFISPYEFLSTLREGAYASLVWKIWGSLTTIVFLNFLFLRHRFCATVCPYGKIQSIVSDERTLAISFDTRRRKECMDCQACINACPVKIDIRQGLNEACIQCAECIDACALRMEGQGRQTLIHYFFGTPGEAGGIIGANVWLIGSVTAFFFIFFLYQIFTMRPIDVTVLPNYSFPPRITESGDAVNSYIISVRNKGKEDADLMIRISGLPGYVRIIPENVLKVRAGEMKKFPVYIIAGSHEMLQKDTHVAFTIGKTLHDENRITSETQFIFPEE